MPASPRVVSIRRFPVKSMGGDDGSVSIVGTATLAWCARA